MRLYYKNICQFKKIFYGTLNFLFLLLNGILVRSSLILRTGFMYIGLASNSLGSRGWPWISVSPVLTFKMLGLETWTTTTRCWGSEGFIHARQTLCQCNYLTLCFLFNFLKNILYVYSQFLFISKNVQLVAIRSVKVKFLWLPSKLNFTYIIYFTSLTE